MRKAQTHHAWRLANEIAHFEHVYTDGFYAERDVDRGGAAVGPIRPLPSPISESPRLADLRSALRARVWDCQPCQEENAFSYAHRMLQTLIPQTAPDFAARLRSLSLGRSERPIRWLALCVGAASIEGSLLESAGVPVELCLVDVNEGLLETAARRMPAIAKVERVLGDANEIGPELGSFDIVNITSGLHHLVELERVLSAIARMLRPDGEFWLIGEQVGRNGNRLWPEAIEIANAIFSSWPPEKRLNHNTGRVDEALPDLDCSSASFEGIRSQDITELLGRYFLPVDCYVRDAFLWRLVDVAYAANFDVQDEKDRQFLRHAVVEEALLWARGARGTELHGVFRSKWACLGQIAAQTAPMRAVPSGQQTSH
ncbi:MAG TPA: class I SAM-dependent methyltransferase [Rhodanobacteraceae bacterium]|nr:class I SAM-dependent methyltransferase [Rhodanobacteraceae bacterium]